MQWPKNLSTVPDPMNPPPPEFSPKKAVKENSTMTIPPDHDCICIRLNRKLHFTHDFQAFSSMPVCLTQICFLIFFFLVICFCKFGFRKCLVFAIFGGSPSLVPPLSESPQLDIQYIRMPRAMSVDL